MFILFKPRIQNVNTTIKMYPIVTLRMSEANLSRVSFITTEEIYIYPNKI